MVNFYTILSHVLDSDSEILAMNFLFFFFFQKSHQKSPFKGLFLKIFFQGACHRTPLLLLGYQLSIAATKKIKDMWSELFLS